MIVINAHLLNAFSFILINSPFIIMFCSAIRYLQLIITGAILSGVTVIAYLNTTLPSHLFCLYIRYKNIKIE